MLAQNSEQQESDLLIDHLLKLVVALKWHLLVVSSVGIDLGTGLESGSVSHRSSTVPNRARPIEDSKGDFEKGNLKKERLKDVLREFEKNDECQEKSNFQNCVYTSKY